MRVCCSLVELLDDSTRRRLEDEQEWPQHKQETLLANPKGLQQKTQYRSNQELQVGIIA
jgi:hypothetical protein